MRGDCVGVTAAVRAVLGWVGTGWEKSLTAAVRAVLGLGLGGWAEN